MKPKTSTRKEWPTVAKSYTIDQRAVKEFLSWLPDEWLPRKQDPDLFLDYLVEVTQAGEPTGRQFAAQIKGFENLPANKARSYPFKTKHLNYYVERCQVPVFLFLIDVSNREGWWLFAQRALKIIPRALLKENQTVTLKFSADDNLLNIAKFECLLPDAESFVRDLHPGSIEAAVRKRKEELESKDRRFSVKVDSEGNCPKIQIEPKQTLSFKGRLRPAGVAAVVELLESGSPIILTGNDIEFIAAPLLQEVAEHSGVELVLGDQKPSVLHIVNRRGEVIPIKGNTSIGLKSGMFSGTLAGGVITMSLEIHRRSPAPAQWLLGIHPEVWTGQPILGLYEFDLVEALLQSFQGVEEPKMELFIEGRSVVKTGSEPSVSNQYRQFIKHLETVVSSLKKLRWLSTHFKVNPMLPTLDLLNRSANELLQIYDILNGGWRTVIPNDFFLEIPIPRAVPEFPFTCEFDVEFQTIEDEKSMNFFGTPLKRPMTQQTFTGLKFLSSSSKDGYEKLVFLGNKETTITVALFDGPYEDKFCIRRLR